VPFKPSITVDGMKDSLREISVWSRSSNRVSGFRNARAMQNAADVISRI